MLHRAGTSLGIAAALILTLAVAACGGDEPTPVPREFVPQRATARAMPTATPKPTATAEPTATKNPTQKAAGETRLPTSPDDVVVQFGRIENRPGQPDILAQMTPNLSLQGNGYMVYRHEGGSSADGWYQTVLTPTLTVDFVKKLVDEIKVLEMAEKLPAPKVAFATKKDGTSDGPKAYGVIYVKTADDEGRLILTQEQLENPSGPYAANIRKLEEMIRALEFWRANTEGSPSAAQKAAVASSLGWWIDPRVPYTPTGALAFGTRAPSWLPADAPIGTWPLDSDLAEAISAKYGAVPSELPIAPDEVAELIRAGRSQPRSFWGPLWRQGADGVPYIIGIRPAVPGSNNVVIDDYAYTVPKQDVKPGAGGAE